MGQPVAHAPFSSRSTRLVAAAPAAAPSERPSWSWRLGEIAGIGVYVHASFAFLLAWVAFRHYATGGGLAGMASGVALILAIFAIIVLHELGHALTARKFGIRTRSITLLPIGGVALLERMPEKPSQELLVALAGPAVNVVLAAALTVVAVTIGQSPALAGLDVVGGPLLLKLILVNVSLAVFNLIPAFPMDGGRALRALLAFKMSRVRATEVAVAVGHAFAALFGMVGLLFNPMLALVAAFVWIGASQELAMVRVQSALSEVTVGRATMRRFWTLTPDAPLSAAVELVIAGAQHDFPVFDGPRLVGVLTRADIVRGLSTSGPGSPVGAAMHRTFATASPYETLEQALPRIQTGDPVPAMVMDGGSLVGMLTAENVAALLAIRDATTPRA